MRAPQELRFVLATRHDLRLGLHRLRLEGELTEIREPDLRFTVDEARKLVSAAGVELPEPALALLHGRTEGWAAGLRLAALSLAGHPDPGRFAEEFSGSERTVAEYLLAEVLERQSDAVRQLLLRTSILERVSGPLADALTGGSGGERTLQELEETNAFVVALDAARSWFRYHHLFADLLQLELRRTAPGEVTALHRVATSWFAGHGHPIEAVRHAQAGSWAGRPQPCTSSSPVSPLRPPRQMPSSPCSWRPTSWLRGHSKRRRRIWGWRRGGPRRRRQVILRRCRPAGMSSCRSCSRWSGCCWLGSAVIRLRWRKRRGGCRR
jgi:hypothetical protein